MSEEKATEKIAEEKQETVVENTGKPEEKKSFAKKLLKGIVKTLVGIVLFLVIAVACLLIFIDPIIKGVVENFGPEIAGVRFELESISVKLFRGRVEIKNLIMYNPDDFNSEYAVKLGDVAMETEIMSWINQDKAIIREIRLRDVTINYEAPFPQLQNSNIQAILDNVTKAAEKEKQQLEQQEVEQPEEEAQEEIEQPEEKAQEEVKEVEQPETEAQEETGAPEPKRFQLDKLIIDNVQLAVVIKNRPEIRLPLTVTLPEMGPVGTDEEGVTGLELTGELATAIVGGVTESVLKSSDEIASVIAKQSAEIAKEVEETAKEVEEDVKDVVKSFKDGKGKEAIEKSKEVIDSALKDENVKEIGEGLKGLWNDMTK